MASLGDLVVTVGANISGFKSAMQDVSNGLVTFGEATEKLLGGLAEKLAFAALAKSAFDAANTIDEAMDTIVKATGATGEKFDQMQASFKEVFGDAIQSSDDLAGALAVLSQRTGATGEELTALTAINSKFAQVTDQQMKPAVEATQKVFQAWGIATKDQADKLDALVAVSQKTGVGVAAITSSLQGAGAVLRTLGMDFNSSAALMANFAAKGLDAERVAGALKIGLTALSKEGVKEPEAAMRGLIERLVQAKTPMDALTIASEDFGKRGALYIVDAAQRGGFAIDDLKVAAGAASGTIVSTAAATESWGEKLDKLKNSVTLALEPLGKALQDMVPSLEGIAKGLVPAAIGFERIATAVAGLVPDFLKIIGSAQSMIALGTAIGFVGAALAAVVETAHAAVLQITDLATGNFSQFAKDFKDAGPAMQKAWVESFASIATKGQELQDSLHETIFAVKETSTASVDLGSGLTTAAAGMGSLTKELKRAEDALGVVKKAFEIGAASAEDLAKAEEKVYQITVRLHPEFKNTRKYSDELKQSLSLSAAGFKELGDKAFAAQFQVKSWSEILGISNDQIQLFSRSYPFLIEAIERESKALANQNPLLKANAVNMKELDAIVKQSQVDIMGQAKSIQQLTIEYGFLHDQSVLGITDSETMARRAEDIRVAYGNVTRAVDDQGKAIYGLGTVRLAEIRMLQEQIREQQALGNDTTALQLKMDHLSESLARQNDGWVTTIRNMRNIAQSGITQLTHDLIFDIDRLGDTAKRLGETMVTVFVDHIMQQALKPALDMMDNLLERLGRFITNALGLGGGGGGGVLGTSVGAAGGAAGTIGGIPGMPNGGMGTPSQFPQIPGLGGTAGSAGGAAGSVAGAGITGVVGAVAGVVSAVSDVISNFQLARQEGTLNAIEAHTKVMAIGLVGISAPWEKQAKGQFSIFDTLNKYLPMIEGVGDNVRDRIAPYLLDISGKLNALVVGTLAALLSVGGNVKEGAPATAASIAAALAAATATSAASVESGLLTVRDRLVDLKAAVLDSTSAQTRQLENALGTLADNIYKSINPLGMVGTILGAIGGGLGSIGSSIGSIIGSAAGAAVGGIANSFTGPRQEGTLNAIEQHTKVMAIVMTGISAPWEKVADGQDTLMGKLGDIRNSMVDAFAAGSGHIWNFTHETASSLKDYIQPAVIAMAESLRSIDSKVFAPNVGTVGDTSNQSIVINVNGAGDPASVAKAVMDLLKTQSPVFV